MSGTGAMARGHLAYGGRSRDHDRPLVPVWPVDAVPKPKPAPKPAAPLSGTKVKNGKPGSPSVHYQGYSD